MDPARFDEKAVLVTGAASGIGKQIAIRFASRGARLFLSDVNEEGLNETARVAGGYGNPVRVDRVDVSSRDAMRDYAELVHRDVEAIDVLVNNAGVAVSGSFLDTTLGDWDFLIGTNLWGVVYGCHYFIPKMVERHRRGHVVNIASAAGLVAPLELAAYATTKFAVVGLSEALRDELAPEGIGVSVICPGMVSSGITRAARFRGELSEQKEGVIDAFRKRNYGPERVADAVVDAVASNKGLVPVTPEAWLLYALKRASPTLIPSLLRRVRERTGR